MYVTFDPENQTEKQTWDFDPDDMLKSEMLLVEKHFGQSIDIWIDAIRGGSMKARAVLLWLLVFRDHKSHQFKDVPDFRKRQLVVEMSSQELRAVYDKIAKTKMSDSDREQFDAIFERDLRDAMERENGVVEGDVVDSTEVALGKPQ